MGCGASRAAAAKKRYELVQRDLEEAEDPNLKELRLGCVAMLPTTCAVASAMNTTTAWLTEPHH
jgi:hypothetical protein